MIPRPAQYLLRFDDLCPTASPARWARFVTLIRETGVRPILAVIPDNLDQTLNQSPPEPGFWEQMRALEAAGATIALHGYHHLCKSKGKSLLPLHRHTEFAGVRATTQQQWINEGLRLLHAEGLTPKLFVAPRHGFDHATLYALRQEGIKVLSDGFAREPFRRGGLTWIPQQLWGTLEKESGLWTICVHADSAHEWQVEQLRRFIGKHEAQFTSFERVMEELPAVRLGLIERFTASLRMWRVRISHERKRRLRPPRIR
ncbi:MAG: DUF2334 domain-containing protein [Terracidiphilus sp.]